MTICIDCGNHFWLSSALAVDAFAHASTHFTSLHSTPSQKCGSSQCGFAIMTHCPSPMPSDRYLPHKSRNRCNDICKCKN